MEFCLLDDHATFQSWQKHPGRKLMEFKIFYSYPVCISASAVEKDAFSPQQANTAQHIPSIIQLAEIFMVDRWEWECGWNYRYLSAAVNLCSNQLPAPGVKVIKRNSLGTGALPGDAERADQILWKQRQTGVNERRRVWSLVRMKHCQPESP